MKKKKRGLKKMITNIEHQLLLLLKEKLLTAYNLELPETQLFEIPSDKKWGDLSCRVPFLLSKIIKKPPLQIAQELCSCFNSNSYVRATSIAGNGFINIHLDRKKYLALMVDSLQQEKKQTCSEKIIIEHTNINPNKAAHIGHIRNACLGDTLARMFKYLDYTVEVQNYIDDTGVQLADVIAGLVYLEKKNLQEIQSIQVNLDYYCWNLYTKVNNWYEQHEENRNKRFEVLKCIEDGNNEISEIAHYVSKNIVKAHLQTMERLVIQYNLLT